MVDAFVNSGDVAFLDAALIRKSGLERDKQKHIVDHDDKMGIDNSLIVLMNDD